VVGDVDPIGKSGLREGQSVSRLLGARYVVLPVEDPRDPKEKRTGIEPMLDPLPGTRLYRVPGTLPRVFLAGQAHVADDATALGRILDPAVVAGKMAWLAPDSDARTLPSPADSAPGICALDFTDTRKPDCGLELREGRQELNARVDRR
jgi:hypothetical protein